MRKGDGNRIDEFLDLTVARKDLDWLCEKLNYSPGGEAFSASSGDVLGKPSRDGGSQWTSCDSTGCAKVGSKSGSARTSKDSEYSRAATARAQVTGV